MLTLVSIGLQLAGPQIVRLFVDATQRGASDALLITAALSYIALTLGQRVVYFGAFAVGTRLGFAATDALRDDLTRHVLALDMSFHKRHTPGELIARVERDVSDLANMLSGFTVRIVANLLLMLGVLVLLARENVLVALGASIYALLSFAILWLLQQRVAPRWEEHQQASAEQFGYIEERLGGTEDLRSSGAEAYTLRRLDGHGAALLRTEVHALTGTVSGDAIGSWLAALAYALALGAGAWLYTSGQTTIGGAFLLIFYIAMLGSPLDQIRAQANDFQQASAAAKRVRALIAEQPLVQPPTTPQSLPPGAPTLVLDGVRFAYDDAEAGSEPALRDVSFALAAGRVLGVVGRTGSGKSTLARLLLRLYDPTAGSIKLAGVDLRAIAPDVLRQRVAVVTQEVELFSATLRDNLTLFDETIGDDKIRAALHTLGLEPWLARQPAGLDTRLGAGGGGVSAGEAQLLAFARVFLRDPGLVILDEASSRLDPTTERLLDNVTAQLLRGRTAVIIAHRLETMRHVDDVLVMEGGRVAEYGSRAALADDPASRFAALLRTGDMEALG